PWSGSKITITRTLWVTATSTTSMIRPNVLRAMSVSSRREHERTGFGTSFMGSGRFDTGGTHEAASPVSSLLICLGAYLRASACRLARSASATQSAFIALGKGCISTEDIAGMIAGIDRELGRRKKRVSPWVDLTMSGSTITSKDGV